MTSLLSCALFGARVGIGIADSSDRATLVLELATATAGLVAFVWLLLFYFWARGAIRVRVLARRFPDAVFLDVVVNYVLANDLQLLNRDLGVEPRRIWSNGYITVATTRDQMIFHSGTWRPRVLCAIPAEVIAGLDIDTIDFPTRTMVRHFPAIVVKPTVWAKGANFGMLPMRTTLMIPRKLTAIQLRHALDDVAARLGVSPEG